MLAVSGLADGVLLSASSYVCTLMVFHDETSLHKRVRVTVIYTACCKLTFKLDRKRMCHSRAMQYENKQISSQGDSWLCCCAVVITAKHSAVYVVTI